MRLFEIEQRGKIITPPGNTVGLNVFELSPAEREKLNGKIAYHQTTKVDKILKSGGLRPRADRSGEREFALDKISIGKDWRTPKGIFISLKPDQWFGDTISFAIDPADKIVYAYSEGAHLLITNPVSSDRFLKITKDKR